MKTQPCNSCHPLAASGEVDGGRPRRVRRSVTPTTSAHASRRSAAPATTRPSHGASSSPIAARPSAPSSARRSITTSTRPTCTTCHVAAHRDDAAAHAARPRARASAMAATRSRAALRRASTAARVATASASPPRASDARAKADRGRCASRSITARIARRPTARQRSTVAPATPSSRATTSSRSRRRRRRRARRVTTRQGRVQADRHDVHALSQRKHSDARAGNAPTSSRRARSSAVRSRTPRATGDTGRACLPPAHRRPRDVGAAGRDHDHVPRDDRVGRRRRRGRRARRRAAVRDRQKAVAGSRTSPVRRVGDHRRSLLAGSYYTWNLWPW